MDAVAIPQTNIVTRGVNDNRFYWEPTAPLEVEVFVTGIAGGSYYTDYIEVTDIVEYEIGITPDLGWSSYDNMFTPYSPIEPDTTNPLLFLKRNLSLESGTITFTGDHDLLYVDLSTGEMNQIFSNHSKEFIWSVRGYSADKVASAWSEFKRFKNDYIVPDSSFTLVNTDAVSQLRDIKLYGSKSEDITTIEINGYTGNIIFPTNLSWESNLKLDAGTNQFSVRAKNNRGGYSQYKTVNITLTTGDVVPHDIPNTFDHFGSLFGLDRLRSLNETNGEFKERIKDVFKHPSESNLRGLHYAICRNLSLSYDDYALVIRPNVIDYRRSDDFYGPIDIKISANYILVSSDKFFEHNEYHIVRPQDVSVTLSNRLYPISDQNNGIKVCSPQGVEVKNNLYKIDYKNSKLYFADEFKYKEVWITYPKSFEVVLDSTTTLQRVHDDLEEITYNGHQILDVSLSSDLSGTETSDGLLRESFTIIGNDKYKDKNNNLAYGKPIRWSDMSIFHLLDSEYWERFYNEDMHLLNTKIESYVNKFKSKAHKTWDSIILDKDIWDPIDEVTEDSNNIPFMLDSKFGFWKSSHSLHTRRYTTTEAFDRGFISEVDKSILKYIGIPSNMIACGVGRNDDLKVIIPKPQEEESLVEPDVYRATISWTITGQLEDISYLPNTPYGSLFFEL